MIHEAQDVLQHSISLNQQDSEGNMLPTDETRTVLLRHIDAFEHGIDAILADYAPDAVLFTPDGLLRGHARIRAFFQRLLADIFTPDCEFRMLQQLVDGEVAYIVWSARSPGTNIRVGTDTYIIRNGKIVAQTYAAA
jgi:ketosteroid isomerase-like protein